MPELASGRSDRIECRGARTIWVVVTGPQSIFDRYINTFPARGADYAHYIDLSPLRSLTFLRPWSTESWPRLLLFTTKSRSHYVQLNGLNVRLSRPLLPPLFYYWRELCISVVVKVVLLSDY